MVPAVSNPAAVFELSGRVALVTGAQRGIGAEIVRMLAGAGAQVAINYTVEPAAAAALVAEINGGGGKAWALEFDVRESGAVTAGFETLLERSGRLDILVNNAGIREDGLALRMSDGQWREAISANLDGVFYCCRAALALMRKAGGSIVNVSSIAAYAGSAGQANYAAAKAGVIGLSKSLAVEYASRNIRVNCVVPGLIDTQMTQSLKEAYREKFLQQIPLGRFGEPQEVAATVLFLASDAASYITGAAIHVNGGGYLA